MSVFKRRRAGKNGKSKADATWTVEYADHDGVTRRLPAFTDRAASVELERHLKRLVALRMAGAGPDAELSRFLETCPTTARDKLGEWNIITSERAAAGKTLPNHIDDWRLAMESKGNSVRHIRNFLANLNHVASDSGWKHLTDVSSADMNRWIADRKAVGRSAATINHHIRAGKAFCAWLAKEKRISENPLAHIPLLNEKADRRVERHPYNVGELSALLAAAESGKKHHGLSGHERALVYRLAVETGFRWSELRSLNRASFDFQAEPATVTIAAAYAKNGQDDTLPLRGDLAADLKVHMALSLPGAKAFPRMGTDCGAEMIRVDLEAAGILTRNAQGELATKDEYGLVYDFHGLRHTFATMLNQARVPLATAQRLMRHSDPKLTAGIYTHVMIEGKAEALAKMPVIVPMARANEVVAMTGTDAADTDPAVTKQPKNRDRKRDSFTTDADGKIETYRDDAEGVQNAEFMPSGDMSGNEKTPVSQGKTGDSLRWWGEMDSNHRSANTTDLQSVPFGRSGISPSRCFISLHRERMK